MARKRTIFPTAAQQAAVGLVQSIIAHHIAEAQTRQGVNTELAVTHSIRASLAAIAYILVILPITLGLGILVWSSNAAIFLWSRSVAILGIAIGIRLHRYAYTPAYVRLRYRIPTFVLVAFGGAAAFIGILACVLSYLTTPYQY